jgi:hypothetical protein
MTPTTSETITKYLLVSIDVPKNNNTIALANAVSNYLKSQNIENSTLLIKNNVGAKVHEEAQAAFNAGTLGKNEIYVHQVLKDNITNLVVQTQGITGFTNLDKTINYYGSVQNFCGKEGKPPSFSLYHQGNTYYLQHAYMDTTPFSSNGKTIFALMNGYDYPIYKYTFKFNPSNITLKSLFGDNQKGLELTINWLKNQFINQAGWGLPSFGLVQGREENQYNIKDIRMGIDSDDPNTVIVLAPHVSEFHKLTITPILDYRKSHSHVYMSNIPSDLYF